MDLKTKQEWVLTDYEAIREFFSERCSKRAVWIGHNSIAFDAPNLNRLLGTRLSYSSLVDTFVLSMLYSPSLADGHSLDAWGKRLGFEKGNHDDWSRLSEEMIEYCQQDVRVTGLLFEKITERMKSVGFSERSAELEHKAWVLVQKQKKNGFQLDVPRAEQLYSEIRGLERDLKEKIHELWPPELQTVGEFKRAYRLDGTYTSRYEDHKSKFPRLEIRTDGSYEAYDYVEFNLGSPKQRIEKLLELGWEPVKFTPKGNPSVDEDSLAAFALSSGKEEVTALAKWVVLNSRANMINNWLGLADEKGLIHGNLWLAGTLRYRHDKPNTANIPAVRVDSADAPLRGMDGLYTYESRDLWTSRDGELRSLVGVDAKGIQLRILAEYIKDEAFTEAILSVDPHSANQQRMRLPSRALTKTITYATLMGAGDEKIAREAKVTVSEAREAKASFFEQVPGLKKLVNRLKGELKRTGRITLCDGARVMVSSDHMVIPYLLQGDESRIMKQAGVYIDEGCRRSRIDSLLCGSIHDEYQFDVLNDDIDSFRDLCETSFRKSGESFGYDVPIEGSTQVGRTWSQTH
jgi:DNA polymerase-1